MEKRGRYIPLSVRKAVLLRDGHECHYCERPSRLTFDHKLAFSLGGEHTVENLVICCKPCNTRKGTKDYDTFYLARVRYRPLMGRPKPRKKHWYPKEMPIERKRELFALLQFPKFEEAA